jgi:hypothetical protein
MTGQADTRNAIRKRADWIVSWLRMDTEIIAGMREMYGHEYIDCALAALANSMAKTITYTMPAMELRDECDAEVRRG